MYNERQQFAKRYRVYLFYGVSKFKESNGLCIINCKVILNFSCYCVTFVFMAFNSL